MRILIVGAVAAGTSAAAKARRNSPDAEITVYDKGGFISYAACGMPYYFGGHVRKPEDLAPRGPEFFRKKYNVDILTGHEVLSVDAAGRTLEVKKLDTGAVFKDRYDRLVLATGAAAFVPPVPGAGMPHVFTLRNMADMYKISAFIAGNAPKRAVLVGTGFIGLEVCENFARLGMDVTLLEMQPQVAPGVDPDIASILEAHLKSKGVTVILSDSLTEIRGGAVFTKSGAELPADIVIMGTGVRPDTVLARAAGLEIGPTRGIRVNKKMQTSDPYIYACGDCIEQYHMITGTPIYRPLGSIANKTGRIAGDCVTGGALEFRGILGTGICRVFDLTVAMTGLSEHDAKELGYDVLVSLDTKPARPEYMGGKELTVKAVADKASGRLLGAHIAGAEGVDKRIDVLATAITFGASAADLMHLDLAYAPPFSTARDPVMYTGMILDKLN